MASLAVGQAYLWMWMNARIPVSTAIRPLQHTHRPSMDWEFLLNLQFLIHSNLQYLSQFSVSGGRIMSILPVSWLFQYWDASNRPLF